MLIELCGIPGGGKSTFARMYQERFPSEVMLVHVDMYSRLPTLRYSLVFMVQHPIVFFWILVFTAQFHTPGLFWYSLHLSLRACAKYARAKSEKGNAVFVDEGLVHLLCTLPNRALDHEAMCRWVGRVRVSSSVPLIFPEGTFHRFHNAEAVKHPRVQRGIESLSLWEDAVRKNTKSVLQCLMKSGSLHYVFSNEADQANQLHTFLNQQTTV